MNKKDEIKDEIKDELKGWIKRMNKNDELKHIFTPLSTHQTCFYNVEST